MVDGPQGGFAVAGYDRFEAQAEANEARLFAALSAGRHEAAGLRHLARIDGMVSGVQRAALRRRPIGIAPASAPAGGGGLSAEAPGQGSVAIGRLEIRWAARPAVQRSALPVAAPSVAPVAVPQGPGAPLPPATQGLLEQAFGADLSHVRVHTGPDSQQAAQGLGARAFTQGQDIHFGPGQWDPHSAGGLSLLGHEVTHVLQGGDATRLRRSARPFAPADGPGLGGAAADRTAGRIQRKAAGMIRRSAVSGLVPGGGNAGPSVRPAPQGPGHVVIGLLRVVVSDQAPAGGAPGMEVARAKAIQAKGGGGQAPAGLEGVLAQSQGQPLPDDVRKQLEAILASDFRDVKVHTDGPAATAASALQAEAFALGKQIFFAAGRYDPRSARGVALLAHELTHVAQQGGAGSLTLSQRDLVQRKGDAPIKHPDAVAEDRALAAAELEYLTKLFQAAYRERWFLTKEHSGFAGNALEGPSWLGSRVEKFFGGDGKYRYAGCRNFANDTFRLFSELADARYHTVEHVRGFREGKVGPVYYSTGAPHQVVRVTNAVTDEQTVFDMWALAGGWFAGGTTKDPDWKKGIYPWTDFGFRLGVSVEQKHQVLPQSWKHYRDGGRWAHKPYPVIERPERMFPQKKGLTVSGHDALERQALHNEHAVFAALSRGGSILAAGPHLLAAQAGGAALRRRSRGGLALRKAGGGVLRKGKRGASAEPSWFERAQDLTQTWNQAIPLPAHQAGVALGGIFGGMVDFFRPGGGFEALTGEATSDEARLLLQRLEGTPKPWGPAGIFRQARRIASTDHRALQLAYLLVVEHQDMPLRPLAGIDAGEPIFDKYKHFFACAIVAHRSNAMGGAAVGFLKEVGDAVLGGGSYDPADMTANSLGAEFGQALRRGRVLDPTQQAGRAGARSVLRTLDASTLALRAGEAFQVEAVAAAFDPQTGAEGAEFRQAFFAAVESAVARAAVATDPRLANHGAAVWRALATRILADPQTGAAFLAAAGLLGAGSTLSVGGHQVALAAVLQATAQHYGLGGALRKARTRSEETYLDEVEGGDDDWARKGKRLRRALETLDEPGLPLELSLRNRLEAELGASLGAVRVHTGLMAERMAEAIEAEAFTIGKHVFMGPRAYDPDAPEGLGTLAHEATHVVQAEQGRLHGPATPAKVAGLETEAYALEAGVVARARAGAAPGAGPGGWGAGAGPGTRGRGAPPAPRPGPELVVREAPAYDPTPAPDVAPAAPAGRDAAPLKRRTGGGAKKAHADAIEQVMQSWRVEDLSREEFLSVCTERVLELMREEIEVEAERGGTIAWSDALPFE